MGEVRSLLFTDVVDSTKLLEQLGDAAMAALWSAHDRVARKLLVSHRGREIDKSDGFLLLFDTVDDGVAYALAYHRALASLQPPIATRVGLHVGEVILTENAPDVVARGAKPLEVEGLAKAITARVMSVAIGGQTLLTDSACRALGQTSLRLESHGHWRMKGIADPIELFEVGGADAPFTPPPDSAKVYRVVSQGDLWLPVKHVKHSLPAERDAFVGRTADLQALAQRLERGATLVSVLGIGGSGKTRLVIRYAWSWLGDYPGGVWFCDLSEARSVEGIAYAVAQGLDVPLGKDDPVVQLGHAIAGRGRCLVVLDNFEQVARHADETLGRWLDRAADARFVVTSREVLGLPGEEAMALAPLLRVEGVALFNSRARSAKRDFEPDDVASIAALVKLLDGLPLAIELAAARVRVMSPTALLQRMGERFKLLASSGGRHTRQATLRATLDWSWELLSPDEQRALAQLSVFEGGFTLEAAEAVLALEDEWPTDAVQALVDKSLVRMVSDDRFDSLVSVQEYAAEKLRAFGAQPEAQARHGAWFARFGTPEAIDSLNVHGGVARLRALTRELDNVVIACERATHRGDGATAVALLEAAWAVRSLRGPFMVGVSLAKRVLEVPALSAQEELATRCVLAIALQSAGRVDEARTNFDAALASARRVGHRRLEATMLARMGHMDRSQGRMKEARASYDAALAAYREIGDGHFGWIVLGALGLLHADQGRMEEARAHYEEALNVAREAGNRVGEKSLLMNLGILHSQEGRIEDARACYDAALSAARELGTNDGMLLGNIGGLLQGTEIQKARVYFEEALAVAREIGDRRGEGIALGNLGNLLRVLGEHGTARRYLSDALAIHREIRFTFGQPYWLAALADIEADAGRRDAALELAREAVSLAAPFVDVHVTALERLAHVHLARGEVTAAREAIARARTIAPEHAASLAAADALVAVAEGDRVAAEAALAEATADPAWCMPGTEIGQLVARARAALDAASSESR